MASMPESVSDSASESALRDETAAERYDRNWNELLQEMRVTQTGTQILTGFLLALAFQPRFASLSRFEVVVYLVLVALAALATCLGLAPVSLHRTLFRRRAKKELVDLGNVLLKLTLASVATLVTGVVLLVFDVVLGTPAGIVAGVVAATVIAVVWLVLPIASVPRVRE